MAATTSIFDGAEKEEDEKVKRVVENGCKTVLFPIYIQSHNMYE